MLPVTSNIASGHLDVYLYCNVTRSAMQQVGLCGDADVGEIERHWLQRGDGVGPIRPAFAALRAAVEAIVAACGTRPSHAAAPFCAGELVGNATAGA